MPDESNSGQSQAQLTKILTIVLAILLVVIVSMLLGSRKEQTAQVASQAQPTLPPQSPMLPSSSSELSRPATAVAAASPRTAWQYGESEDKMTGQKTKTAVVTSSNTVEFASPYGGPPQHATLILRKMRGSDNVLLTIEKGQLTCGDYFERSVSVRFDEKPPRRFGVSEPADHDSTVVFIRSEKSFIAEAKKAKRIRIEAIVYQNGSPVFEFDVAGLEW